MSKRKIAVITGSRAEYGLLYWIIKMIQDDPKLELQLIVTGMHLSSRFGLTVKQIEKDRFPIAEKVKIPLSLDTEEAIAISMGLGMAGFAKAYSRLKPDIIVVLGDRFEIHAAVSAAVPFRIPVAHIHGGESTEGVFDEQLRHAITKMSHIHFASASLYRQRIIQMGENPEFVFCYGTPAIDNIKRLKFLDRAELSGALGIPYNKKLGVVTYHPVTLESGTSASQIEELLKAIKNINNIHWVFTFSNADTGGKIIIEKIKRYVSKNPERATLRGSLGQQKYLSLLKNASLIVGNSSSGLLEAPSLLLPVVNIGDRQKGRMRPTNVIDVKRCKNQSISKAIRKALSARFRRSLKGLKNPYGRGGVSEKIVEKLKNIPLTEEIVKKKFFTPWK